MCDKKSLRQLKPTEQSKEPKESKGPKPSSPKTAAELLDEYNKKHRKGTYETLMEDYMR